MSDPFLMAAAILSQRQASPGVAPVPKPLALLKQNDRTQSRPQPARVSVKPERSLKLVELARSTQLAQLAQLARPRSSAQFYAQRIAALRAGRLYTRLPMNSFQSFWQSATGQPTYEQWRWLLALEAKAVAGGQGNRRLAVMVGDSLSMWFPSDRLPTGQLWLNQAISGDTSQGVLTRLNDFAQTRPSMVYVMAGINDLKRGVAEAEVLDNLEQIIQRLRSTHPQAQIVVQSLLPTRGVPIDNARINRVNRELRTIAAQKGAMYLDLHAQVMDGNGQLQARLTTDGLHLSPPGYEVWQWGLRQAEVLVAQAGV